MRHELKTINPFFQQVWRGEKTFEIRKNDRGFRVGDKLWLREYSSPSSQKPAYYIGHEIIAKVKHVLTHTDFPDGLKAGYVCLSIEVIERGVGIPEQIFEAQPPTSPPELSQKVEPQPQMDSTLE